jgi:hypothetical protein
VRKLITNHCQLRDVMTEILRRTPVIDCHTHLYSEDFTGLPKWGIDELLTYHYLRSEVFRYADLSYADYWSLDKPRQAELIWNTLFKKAVPVSEVSRGVLTIFKWLGISTASGDLDDIRRQYEKIRRPEQWDRIFNRVNLKYIVMTNDPFDDKEHRIWEDGAGKGDSRFRAALRIDGLINEYPRVYGMMRNWGYQVDENLTALSLREIYRFLNDWINRMEPVYLAVSLPPAFRMPEDSFRGRIIEKVIMPVCAARKIPFAMMIGAKSYTNPEIGDGTTVGKSDIGTIDYLCRAYPHNRFMVTLISRENQHELCVSANKFHNLMPFGCWWYLNLPETISEITSMRMELLGKSFIFQFSDARVPEQLVYKWDHSIRLFGDILLRKYGEVIDAGWPIDESLLEKDISDMLGGNFEKFTRQSL